MRKREGLPSVFFGRAAVYDQWSEVLFNSFRERLARGCFDESLDRASDIVCTVDHDLERILGRTSAGTLKVHRADDGVDVEVDYGDYSFARDLAVAIERGDLRGMSFVFDVKEDSWTRDAAGVPQRTVLKADIFETSFVYHPAYQQTDAGARAVPYTLPVDGDQRAIARAEQTAVCAPLRDARLRRLRLVDAG